MTIRNIVTHVILMHMSTKQIDYYDDIRLSNSVDFTLNDCEIRYSLGRTARGAAARPRQFRR